MQTFLGVRHALDSSVWWTPKNVCVEAYLMQTSAKENKDILNKVFFVSFDTIFC